MTETAYILYRSETTMQPDSGAARGLLATARRINTEHQLTGFLHHEDGFFYQWLEGRADRLDLIAGRIDRDPRHSNMTYLGRGTQTGRQFSEWSMGYSTHSDSSLLVWLAENPVSQRETRAYANAVLTFLVGRNTAAVR